MSIQLNTQSVSGLCASKQFYVYSKRLSSQAFLRFKAFRKYFPQLQLNSLLPQVTISLIIARLLRLKCEPTNIFVVAVFLLEALPIQILQASEKNPIMR